MVKGLELPRSEWAEREYELLKDCPGRMKRAEACGTQWHSGLVAGVRMSAISQVEREGIAARRDIYPSPAAEGC